MKKLLALVLVLMLCCSCALAEETAVAAYAFDPSMVEGVEGSFIAFEDIGLQIFVPANFSAIEISEESAVQGVVYNMGAEDHSMAMSITMAGVADAEGSLITDIETLAAFYAENGVTQTEVAIFNEMPALYYVLDNEGIPYSNLAIATEEGYFIVFSILTNGEEVPMALATVMISSIMPYVAEEVEAAE